MVKMKGKKKSPHLSARDLSLTPLLLCYVDVAVPQCGSPIARRRTARCVELASPSSGADIIVGKALSGGGGGICECAEGSSLCVQ
jgi:hypothetical protein